MRSSNCHLSSTARFNGGIRLAIVEVGRTRYRFSVKALAELLKRSEPAISQMIRRRWEERTDLKETQQLLEFLEKSESKGAELQVVGVEC